MHPFVWLGVAIVAAIVEMASPIFGFIFVTAAALLVAGAAWLGVSLETQLVLFAISVFASIVLVRPMIARRFVAAGKIPSRTERLIGQSAQVTQGIDPVRGGGRVLVAGEDWAAHSSEPIPEGAKVIIDGADGIVLNVTPEE